MDSHNHNEHHSSDESTIEGVHGKEEIIDTEVYTYQTAGGFGEVNGNAVNIEEAMNAYQEVRRELTHQSRISRQKSKHAEDAAEKGNAGDFDLTDFLSNHNASSEAQGFLPKHMGLIWKELTVQGLGADAKTIPTNWTTIRDALSFWKWGKHSGHDFTILKSIDGFCKDGEMLLVLGRPGSGCTTLLRVLANMRASFTNIEGSVTYGGIEASEFAKYYRGEVCYNEEEDLHYPTLTAKQTLKFALKNKTPGKRFEGESKGEFIDKILYLLGNMLGLTKQMNTMVGNAFVRGLSGGERKRLSIAEQMTTRSSINCWDCATRGLDAASALDYVRSLRIMTDILHKTTVSTLYQASDSIFHLFDKVMVLDEGRCIYFGPTSTAKGYFEEMGFFCPSRKSIPDFLTGLCNMNEREYREGFKNKVPVNAIQFEKAYKDSHIYTDMMNERDAYEAKVQQEKPAEKFRQAFLDAHQKYAPKSSPFVATYFQQVKALTVRQFELIYGDKGAVISRYGGVVVKGLITASVFYKMPTNANGTFSRGGAILFSLLFNAMICQAELASFMQGRRVLEKHKHFALYHPSAFYIAQVIADIPLAIVQVIIFELCVYFMMGLNLNAGSYFTFLLNLVTINLCMNGFFRFFGSVSPNFFIASQLSSICLIAFLVYSGYQIPYIKMHPWLMWIYWINPLAYSYKALISAEMHGLYFTCQDHELVPHGPSYTNMDYQICNLAGNKPGIPYVIGDDYLHYAYGYETWQRWIDFVAVLLFFFLFTILTALAMEYITINKEGSVTKVYKAGKAPKPIDENEAMQQVAQEEEEELKAVTDGTTFSWHHIDYVVPVKGGTRQLLTDIGGIVKPGHLTALMGSSGAGKTTLLDVLAQRKTIGKITGRIYMNGEPLADDFERITGYCEQMDVHNPNATIREALKFSAYLRQPADVSKEEKDKYVEDIIRLMEMERIADALIGDLEAGVGISVEERKRLTIATELVGKPKLLFLDEPTSGLDAQSSFNIVRFIRKLADAGWPVLCTIHQPSATLFEHFDHLVLLVRGGRTAYFGEIGPNSSTMIEYFESNGGHKCSPTANPAEYILECVGAGTAGKATQDWADVWKASKEAKALEEELEAIHGGINSQKRKADTYSLNFWAQFWLVYKRMNVSWWRSPNYNMGRLFKVCFLGLISGFSFWKLGNTPSDMQNRLFSVFTTLLMANSMIVLVQPRFMEERLWFRREHASKYYGWAPFALSCILVEIPYLVVSTTIFIFCFYWTAGLQNTSDRVGYFYIHFMVFLFYSVTLGFTIAAFSSTPPMAAVINPFFTSILLLFAGIMQPPAGMPHFWSAWMYWLDPYHYVIEGLVVNVMDSVEVVCKKTSDYYPINIPSGTTCGNYMADFFASGGLGYVKDPEALDSCMYCPYTRGNEFFESVMGWSFDNRWRDFGILVCYTVFNVLLFVFFVYLFRKANR